MIPVIQKPNGCYSACVSSITGIPLEDLPQPTDEELTHEHWHAYNNRLHAVLRAKGWFKVYVADVPLGFSIASGPGPRELEHSCVALDGEVVHDPHPDGGGLVCITEYEVLVKTKGLI